MNALIIFIKNPELGKAKTRLAATIGDKKALKVYKYLLRHTRKNAEKINTKRILFYSKFIDTNDEWKEVFFQKELQHPSPNLGDKMYDAFKKVHGQGVEKALIIGSDCFDLTPEILEQGFKILNNNEATIGKAFDGGYYTVGLNLKMLSKRVDTVLKALFLNKNWSHDDVALEAQQAFERNNLSYALLPTLSDIDNESDLKGPLLKLIS